jgi:hypothetical protein
MNNELRQALVLEGLGSVRSEFFCIPRLKIRAHPTRQRATETSCKFNSSIAPGRESQPKASTLSDGGLAYVRQASFFLLNLRPPTALTLYSPQELHR